MSLATSTTRMGDWNNLLALAASAACQALKTISVRQTEGRAAVEVGVQASELMGSQEASI